MTHRFLSFEILLRFLLNFIFYIQELNTLCSVLSLSHLCVTVYIHFTTSSPNKNSLFFAPLFSHVGNAVLNILEKQTPPERIRVFIHRRGCHWLGTRSGTSTAWRILSSSVPPIRMIPRRFWRASPWLASSGFCVSLATWLSEFFFLFFFFFILFYFF